MLWSIHWTRPENNGYVSGNPWNSKAVFLDCNQLLVSCFRLHSNYCPSIYSSLSFIVNIISLSKICGPHGGEDEDDVLMTPCTLISWYILFGEQWYILLHSKRGETLIGTSALKMETVCFSETVVSTYESTRRYAPEQHLRLHLCIQFRSILL